LKLEKAKYEYEMEEVNQEQIEYICLKSIRGVPAILYDGYYYNRFRDNNKTTYYKCRNIITDGNDNKKECGGAFIYTKIDKSFKTTEHQHDRLKPVQIDIRIALNDINNQIGLNVI
jgi:hypothetical protein